MSRVYQPKGAAALPLTAHELGYGGALALGGTGGRERCITELKIGSPVRDASLVMAQVCGATIS